MILKVRDRTQSQTGIIQSNKKGKSHKILLLVELSHKLVSNSQKKRKSYKILLLVEGSLRGGPFDGELWLYIGLVHILSGQPEVGYFTQVIFTHQHVSSRQISVNEVLKHSLCDVLDLRICNEGIKAPNMPIDQFDNRIIRIVKVWSYLLNSISRQLAIPLSVVEGTQILHSDHKYHLMSLARSKLITKSKLITNRPIFNFWAVLSQWRCCAFFNEISLHIEFDRKSRRGKL